MARPLQKKKNKSSLHRVRQKPKSKRINIKSNPIVAANWDQTQTLSQNYRRLGLSSKLNAHTGGTDLNKLRDRESVLAIPSSKAPKTLGNEEVKVLRDPKTGAIVSVQSSSTAAESKRKRNPLNDPLNDLSDSTDSEDNDEVFNGIGGGEDDDDEGARSKGIVPELEASARFEKRKRPRAQSQREREWCRALVKRWGEDWGAMGRDRGLNPRQQSVGEVRRRVGVWMRGRKAVGEGEA